MMDDSLADDGAKRRHAVRQPLRHTAAMQWKVRAAAAAGHLIAVCREIILQPIKWMPICQSCSEPTAPMGVCGRSPVSVQRPQLKAADVQAKSAPRMRKSAGLSSERNTKSPWRPSNIDLAPQNDACPPAFNWSISSPPIRAVVRKSVRGADFAKAPLANIAKPSIPNKNALRPSCSPSFLKH